MPPVTSSSASTSVSGAIRKVASPISSAKTPPGPNATSGPKTGSWTTPASSSVPPVEVLLHDHRRADPLDRRRAPAARPARSSAIAAALRLVRARRRGLDDDRVADLLRGGDRLVRAPRRCAPATSGMPYAVEQLAGLRRGRASPRPRPRRPPARRRGRSRRAPAPFPPAGAATRRGLPRARARAPPTPGTRSCATSDSQQRRPAFPRR